MKKILSLFSVIMLFMFFIVPRSYSIQSSKVMYQTSSYNLIPNLSVSSSYFKNTLKIGLGHFAYGETPGDSDSGTAYTLVDRLNYHDGLFIGTGRIGVGYVPATYNYPGVSANVRYSLNDFSLGAGIDPITMNDRIQNELYLSLGQFTHSWIAANASFTGGLSGYDEYYTVDYLNATYKNIYMISPRLSNVFKVSYLWGLNGTATTKGYGLYVGGYQVPNIQNNMSGENEYQLAEGVRYRLDNATSLVADVYYSSLFLKTSNTSFEIYEPSSMTHQYGLQLGVSYKF